MQPVRGLCSDTQHSEMGGVFTVKCWCCVCLTVLSCSVCHQIVRALEHLHSKLSVIHRGRCWLGFVWCGWSAQSHGLCLWGPCRGVWWHLGLWWADLDAQGLFLRCIFHASPCVMLFFSSFLDERLNIMTDFLTACTCVDISGPL